MGDSFEKPPLSSPEHRDPSFEHLQRSHRYSQARKDKDCLFLIALLTVTSNALIKGPKLIKYVKNFIISDQKVDKSMLTYLKNILPDLYNSIRGIKTSEDTVNVLSKLVAILTDRQNLTLRNGVILLTGLGTVIGIRLSQQIWKPKLIKALSSLQKWVKDRTKWVKESASSLWDRAKDAWRTDEEMKNNLFAKPELNSRSPEHLEPL